VIHRVYTIAEIDEEQGITQEDIDESRIQVLPFIICAYFCSMMAEISLIKMSCSDLRSKLGKGVRIPG
jgi:hypothetical protein